VDVLIDAETLAAQLLGSEPPAVLDVRWALTGGNGPDLHAQGHVPGAVYVDMDTELAAPPSVEGGRHPLPAIDDLQRAARRWGVRDGSTVVVYDDAGNVSAARAWWLLRWAGLNSVLLLDGGLRAWRDAGLELETGNVVPDPGDVTLSADSLPVIDADAAAQFVAAGILLDARSAERFRGEREIVDPVAGHIPGARSAPTTENLDADQRFADRETLVERFRSLGVDGTRPVAVYCGSGVTAAHEIAALAIAGFDAALYPGSWSQWCGDPARPVATGD
jgi:thiosulfate/3-mercaptopyruvate sulfurtransferase